MFATKSVSLADAYECIFTPHIPLNSNHKTICFNKWKANYKARKKYLENYIGTTKLLVTFSTEALKCFKVRSAVYFSSSCSGAKMKSLST